MKIGLLGYGTVGSGAAECLNSHPNGSAELYRVFDIREIDKIRDIQVKDVCDIIKNTDVDIVVEVLGGDEPAHSYVKAALEHGKHVVSANKQMLSHHYDELIGLAKENGVTIAFSAAAGGSIPWLVNLLRASRVDDILSVSGVMNGTTNYILDVMQTDDESDFDDVLKETQRLGYAEADPSADIDGLDVRAKLALSCDVAYSVMVEPEDIPALGIRYITKRDIGFFRTLGYNCRLIGTAEKVGDEFAVYVEPMLFTPDSEEYNLSGAGNLIAYRGGKMGKQAFYGLGAGKEPTGSAIINDVFDIDAGISVFKNADCTGKIKCRPDLSRHSYYLRTAGEFDRSIIKEALADDVFITKEISVEYLHRLAEGLISSGIPVFAAGIVNNR